jgi:hypothetical protein
MADVNVRESFYVVPEDSNKSASAAHVQVYRPLTTNVASDKISGQVIFEINTGFNEYLDLFKTHLELQFQTDAGTAANVDDSFLANMFSRGQMYVNGIKVAASQNWTQDSILSKRLNFSRSYNAATNGFLYAAPGAPTVASSSYTTHEYLDALFIRTPECIIPPNCNVRFLFDVDSDWFQKAALLVTNGVGEEDLFDLKTLVMNVYTIVQSTTVPDDWTVKFLTLNSFLSSASSTSENRQYQVSHNITKACLTMLSTAHKTAAAGKVYAGHLFTYLNDGDAGANRITALDFKLNNISIPNSRWDFTYGKRGAYINFINESGGILDPSGKETYAEWEAVRGPIHVANIVKPAGDKSNSLQINAQFAAAPAAFLILTSIEENIITIYYDKKSGAVINTGINL